MKVCRKCKISLRIVDFEYRKDTNKYRTMCKTCRSIQRYGSESPNDRKKRLDKMKSRYRENSEEYKDSVTRMRKDNPSRVMLYSAKRRASRDGLPFDIEESDIVIPEYCPILNIKLDYDNKDTRENSPSLDKIVPELGYVKGNISVISCRANRIKSDASVDELEAILKYYKEKTNGDAQVPRM